MSRKNLIIKASILLIISMLVIPFAIMKLCKPDEAMSYTMLIFFAVNPLTVLGIGVLAGADIKKLFWMPIVASAIFPPFFWLALGEIVIELYIYSMIYLAIGVASAVITHLFKKYKN